MRDRPAPDPTEMDAWRERLGFMADGAAFATASSWLQPVRTAADEAAMLKVARADYERTGGAVMAAYAGRGAARVLARDGDGVVLERLATTPSLSNDVEDDEALRAICGAASELHRTSPQQAPAVDGLTRRFRSLGCGDDLGFPTHC